MRPIKFGKYSLLERISHGGMAEVFRAKTFGAAGFERTVAIKLLLPTVAMDKEFITMLIDEAKIAGQLSHANIAQIFDLGMAEGRYYIVQEFVNGKDLRAILRHLGDKDEKLSIAQSCHLMLKVCEGLEYAHNKRDANGRALNLVHRDVSPQNIVVSREGEVKLIDFGIAKAEGRATRTLAGLVKGKFAYMSPEQIRGLPVDRRSDVFACGIVLWELLTGKPLFRRKSEFETLKRARSAEIEPPSDVNPEIPGALDKIVLTALARHVEDRYQTAIELRDALWEFVRGHGHFYSRNEVAAWMRDTFGKSKDDDSEPAASAGYSAELQAEGTAQLSDADAFEGRTIVDPALADRFHKGGGPASLNGGGAGDTDGRWGTLDELAQGPNPDRIELAQDYRDRLVTTPEKSDPDPEATAERPKAIEVDRAPTDDQRASRPEPGAPGASPEPDDPDDEPTRDNGRRLPQPEDSAALTHSFRRSTARYGAPKPPVDASDPLRQPTAEVTSPYRSRKPLPGVGPAPASPASPPPGSGGSGPMPPLGAPSQPPPGPGPNAMAPMASPAAGSGRLPAQAPPRQSGPFPAAQGSERIEKRVEIPAHLQATDKIDRTDPPAVAQSSSRLGSYLLAAALFLLLLAGATTITLVVTGN